MDYRLSHQSSGFNRRPPLSRFVSNEFCKFLG